MMDSPVVSIAAMTFVLFLGDLSPARIGVRLSVKFFLAKEVRPLRKVTTIQSETTTVSNLDCRATMLYMYVPP
jgi:hypothetical protein